MGYAQTYAGTPLYVPSDDVLAQSLSDETTGSNSWVKIKEVTLVTGIDTKSLFRYKFGMYGSTGAGTGNWGQLRRNGVPVGTAQYTDSNVEVSYVEDLASTSWVVGDKVQVYAYNDKNHTCHILNFKLCGIAQTWT